AGTTTFAINHAPASLVESNDAGEPSIGSDWATGKAMYQSGLGTYRVSYDSAGTATWTDVSPVLTSLTTLDPILATDRATHRTFVSQLAGECSLMAFTDDDGASWTQNPVGCGLAAGVDHQTVGGGPGTSGLPGTTVGYPDVTYYCSQAVVSAQCNVSRDGGLTFGPGVPIYTAADCGGLHGHVAVAPDGTAYVPNADCGGQQGVATSKDDGTTWSVLTVPGSRTQDESDPSVAVGSGGTAYFGFAQDTTAGGVSSSAPYVSVLRGGSFAAPVDVSGGTIKNVQFPTMVAGDDGKAAMAFLGTTTPGDDQASTFAGTWQLYVATTVDGGSTWTLAQATPDSDPVQKGCIWLGGGSNACRNLLDFIGATVDPTGRVLVAYADGCDATCAAGGRNDHGALASVAVQTGGPLLLGSTPTASPTATATASPSPSAAPAHGSKKPKH
ncbi:MAG: sialidase family protein, partial [Mycobacteriales bacterium]